MPETTLITLQCPHEQMDLELPLQTEISQWLPGLVRALGFRQGTAWLCSRGQALDPRYSLADYGIWDGAIVNLEIQGGLKA